jgi:putative hydroxymethylpyrimidine transporter CytX
VLTSSLIWFGAAVSIAEVITGSLIAPLGFERGMAAILLGHLIGAIPLLLAALIGSDTGQSAMGTVRRAFGRAGGALFSVLNIAQLLGWTAVMISAGAAACEQILDLSLPWIWPAVIALLICLWILVSAGGLKWLGAVSAVMLAVFCLVASVFVFAGSDIFVAASAIPGDISFGGAVELAAAMPLSWLPLISDYTRRASRKVLVPVTSVAVYTLVSCWMFAIGLGLAIYAWQNAASEDLVQLMLALGLGAVALPAVILQTVTTTYLDANSAGVSFASITGRAPEKAAAVLACLGGMLIAIFASEGAYVDFLYLISAVFAPMSAVLIVDHFIYRRDSSKKLFCWSNLVIWAIGFASALLLMEFPVIDSPVGTTLLVMLGSAIMAIISGAWLNRR